MQPGLVRPAVKPIVDALVAGNKDFVAAGWDPADADLPGVPAKKLAVVACMDTRYAVERVLGLEHGDAKIIRNAGNRLDDGALRSLIVAVHAMGVEHIAIMGHTKCGMTQIGHGDFPVAHHIAASTDVALHEVMKPDFQRWLRTRQRTNSVDLVRHHPYMPSSLEVVGLVYDNDTGRVRQVA